MRSIAAALGTAALGIAAYQGLGMAGILNHSPIQGYIGGLIPALSGLLAGIAYSYAFSPIPHFSED